MLLSISYCKLPACMQGTSPQLLVTWWRLAYWYGFAVQFTVLPFHQEYADSGHFTVGDRISTAIRNNLIFYAVLVVAILLAMSFCHANMPYSLTCWLPSTELLNMADNMNTGVTCTIRVSHAVTSCVTCKATTWISNCHCLVSHKSYAASQHFPNCPQVCVLKAHVCCRAYTSHDCAAVACSVLQLSVAPSFSTQVGKNQ